MIIHSDWHIHSEASYDSTLSFDDIKAGTAQFRQIGITDHLNFNDNKFIGDIHLSAQLVKEFQKENPKTVLGVELTPIERPAFDYIARTGERETYQPPETDTPYDIELAMSKAELMELGVRYAIGASHWRVDIPGGWAINDNVDDVIREWYRQQLWLACDERVTVLGHPWYSGSSLWYKDFTIIPRSMNMDIAAALKENGKYVECNSHFFNTPKTTELFKHQYAEFLRELHEMGISVVYGSDSHNTYEQHHIATEQYLMDAGFKDGDIVEIAESSLW